MQIPASKLLSPSEAQTDHMLLPTLSVKEEKEMLYVCKDGHNYLSNTVKAQIQKQKFIEKQSRVQLNQLMLRGGRIDYLSPFKEKRRRQTLDNNKQMDWATYVQTASINQIKPTKQSIYLAHLS